MWAVCCKRPMCRNLLFENSGCDERLVSGSWVVAPQPNTVHSSVVVGQLLRLVLERKSNCDRVLRTEFQRTPVAFGSAVCDWNQLRRSFFWTALSAVKSYGQEAGERQESLHLDQRIEKVGVMCSMPEQLPLIYRCGDWCNDQKSVQRQCIHVLFPCHAACQLTKIDLTNAPNVPMNLHKEYFVTLEIMWSTIWHQIIVIDWRATR